MPSLEAEDLACWRGGRLLIEAVSWRLAAGDALLVTGANGSGKSSLLRLVAGFLPPAGGSLRYEGRGVLDDLPGWRRNLHHLGWQDALKPALTVRENLTFAAGILGGDPGRIDAALEAFALADLADTPARFLSSGQRRRTALARLFAVPRPIWLLDEPATGLDGTNRTRLEALLDRHRESGGIALIASHGDVAVPDAHVLDLGG